MKRVNVGCGTTPTPGWINYDNSLSVRLAKHPLLAAALDRLGLIDESQQSLIIAAKNGDIRWADATALIPLPDSSVEVLYTSHMVEHLDRERVKTFFSEVRRILAPNGIIRIAVPDLKKLVTEYEVRGDADAFIERSLLTRPKPTKIVDKLKYLVVGDRHHQWMYDGQSMIRLLAATGFKDPRTLPPGSTLIADPDPLDLWERAEESVYVEAYKG
jgi:predicted SAM-dependent methyltransferase